MTLHISGLFVCRGIHPLPLQRSSHVYVESWHHICHKVFLWKDTTLHISCDLFVYRYVPLDMTEVKSFVCTVLTSHMSFSLCVTPLQSHDRHYMSNNKSNLHSFQSRCLYVKLFSPSTTHKKESLTKRHGPGRQSTCVCQIIRGWMFCENKGTRQFLYVKLFEGRVVPNLHRTQESVAVCCSVLQCIAVCCSALQCAVC